jgi:hypothetical protein
MNAVSNELETCTAECTALCKVYDQVAWNTEQEMKKHKKMCKGYKILMYKYDALKARIERLAKPVGECEVDANQEDMDTGDEKLCDESLVSLVEQNLVSLSRSLEGVKEQLLQMLQIQPMVREVKMEKVDSSEELGCRRELLQYLEHKPSTHVPLTEEILDKDKKKH